MLTVQFDPVGVRHKTPTSMCQATYNDRNYDFRPEYCTHGASLSMAQAIEQDIFLDLPGISGNGTVPGFENQIVLNSYRQVFTDSTLLKKGQLRCKVVLTKVTSNASPALWAAALSGTVFEEATVNMLAATESFATFTMTSAKILKILIEEGDEEFRNSPNTNRPGEKFIITYDLMTFRFGTTTDSWS